MSFLKSTSKSYIPVTEQFVLNLVVTGIREIILRNLFSTLFYFILVSNEMTIIYLQGERDDEDFPFLDDEGIE